MIGRRAALRALFALPGAVLAGEPKAATIPLDLLHRHTTQALERQMRAAFAELNAREGRRE